MSHDKLPKTTPQIDKLQLPADPDWQTMDDVPSEFRQVVELHMMAQRDGAYIDDVQRAPVSLDEVYETYDGWSAGQTVLVSRSDEGSIDGMLSYYFEKDGTPFLESVAVDPDVQGSGIGAALIDEALEDLRATSEAPYAIARAQSRVLDIYTRRWGAEVLDSDDRNGYTKIAVPIPR